MGVFFYNIFLVVFNAGIRIAALFNKKASKWVKGRKNLFTKLEVAIKPVDRVIWMHCASLGEFEQGRPVLEAMKKNYPEHKILLTFFSPSGYEVRKNYEGANWVFYLPLDGSRTARRFLEIVHPELVIFVKYEFWYYYLKKIKYRNIPLLLISAVFLPSYSFFKWHGAIQRKMLSRFDHLFVQNEPSKKLLDDIGMAAICTIAGDTRFDRVTEIAAQAADIPLIAAFCNGAPTIVAGSSWPPDEELLKGLQAYNASLKLIIAPHEINDKHLQEIEQRFPGAFRFSEYKGDPAQVLIIDNIGILSRLYRYATIAYIGGGFGKGIHNTLEAAVYGKAVLFGPNYEKFTEAIELIQRGAAFSVANEQELGAIVARLLRDKDAYAASCRQALNYVQESRGATKTILEFIYVKRLLIR